MPRKKSVTPKRFMTEEELNSTHVRYPAKRRKWSSTGGIVRRRIALTAPSGSTVIGPLRLAYEGPQGSETPSRLEVYQDVDGFLRVLVDGFPIIASQQIADLLHKNISALLLVFNGRSATELQLDIALKGLPFFNATALVEAVFEKDYSNYREENELVDSAWVQFFKELEEIQRERLTPVGEFQHGDLVPILRGYQAAAVGWMLERELSPGELDLTWLDQVADRLDLSTGQALVYNKYAGAIYDPIGSTPTCSGGILADEMGLGKTVIMLAVILNNKRKNLDEFGWQVIAHPVDVKEESEEEAGPSEREMNQETCLDANEKLQLVPTKPGKGVLKTKLMAWYETKLAEVSVRHHRNNRPRRQSFKCTCSRREGKKSVTCMSCGLRQHESCGGYQSHLQYVCASCWRQQHPVPSAATLIVVPPAIFQQWENEVKRHAPTLSVLPYSGVRDTFVQPMFLAEFDVVITTYTALRAETLYTGETSERRLRNEGRFLRTSSPLERVSWWRVVCDEAQMVESDISLVREMARRLVAEHRWCVTGTPIQRGVADLFYLTSFMGIGAFDDKSIWTDFLLKPYLAGYKKPLLTVLNRIFWRSTKDEVRDQLNLPEQTFQCHLLKFTAIEETFYMQQHALTASKFAEGLRKSGLDVGLSLDSLDKTTLKRLLVPLLNLRQACTHAQVVSGITINSASGAANLAELLQYLCKKTKQECEESLRQHVASLNGLAGLNCLMLQWAEAIDNYRAVLRLAEECKDGVHVDTLQRIHALTNAAQVLERNPSCAPPTLRDDKLKEEAEQLEKKYLSKSEEAFKSSLAQAKASSSEVAAIRQNFESSSDAWWVPVVISLKDFEQEIVDKLAEELHSNDPLEKEAAKFFLAKVTTLRGVEMTIRRWWGDLEKHHKAVTWAITALTNTPCTKLVRQALKCHLRATEKKKQCELCRVEGVLQDLECELFATTRKSLKRKEKVLDGAETKGSWKAHRAERTLFTILSFGRTRCALESWCLRDGKTHARLIEAMKKEFKHLRASWTELNHRVHAEDELAMAKLRLRFAEPWETQQRPSVLALSAPIKADTIHLVPPTEIPVMMCELSDDRDASLSDFRKKQGRMLYLQNLRKDRNATPDPCPVCKNSLEEQWCVLHCGHCFCIECLQMIHGGLTRRVKCPVCREMTEPSDVGFVDTSGNNEITDIPVTGDYSTKVDSIVREVLRLVQTDSTVKILIFSTWAEVLKILGQAFTTNKISYVSLPSGKHQNVLQSFRDPGSGITVLLLPLAWGSKGLNLMEATHVFLVEPILNPAEELQAIGRVHRIGQTRPTVVHRFIVKGTVEEKIFSVVSEAKDSWSNKTATLADLQRLFVIPERQSGTTQ